MRIQLASPPICTSFQKAHFSQTAVVASKSRLVRSTEKKIKPAGHWNVLANQRDFLDDIGRELGFKSLDDWYDIDGIATIRKKKGSHLLNLYNNSFYKLVSTVYNEREWLPWRFRRSPVGFWRIKDNQRQYLDWVGKQLGYSKMEDWYHVKLDDLNRLGAQTLLQLYHSSIPSTITSVYNDYPWDISKFPVRVPSSSLEKQKQVLDSVAQTLGIQKMEDWYNVPLERVRNMEGMSGVLAYYDFKLAFALQAVYPDFNWQTWRFNIVPKGYWNDINNQRKFFDWLSGELNITELDQWYHITPGDIASRGGSSLMRNIHGNSMYKALSAIYPNHPWKGWKFQAVPKGYWKDDNNVRQFLSEAQEQLQVKRLDDWYSVSLDQIRNLGGGALVSGGQAFFEVLKRIFPEHSWNLPSFSSKSKKASQRWLRISLENLFPGEEIREDFAHPDVHLENGTQLFLDLYLPAYRLAFEYHGQQHYSDLFFFAPQQVYQYKDDKKKQLCKNLGITLLEVPFWWDKEKSSLAATIQKYCPNIQFPPHVVTKITQPIPEVPPKDQLAESKQKASSVALPKSWEVSSDPTGWWICEKLDGIRALWDGNHLVTKEGKTLEVPLHIASSLPQCALDGELWLGYGKSEELKTALQSGTWNDVQYLVYDAPSLTEPLEKRIQFLDTLKSQLPPFCRFVRPQQCQGHEHLMEVLKDVLSRAGEGILLRQPGSLYKRGRSTSYQLLRAFQDSDVQVISAVPQQNGLLCRQSNGTEVVVRCGHDLLAHPPESGGIISVKHLGSWRSGRLKYPFFWKMKQGAQL